MIDLPAVAYALSADLLDLIVVLYVLIVVFHELTAEALAIFCFDGANVKSVNFLLASAKAVFHFAMETVSGLGKMLPQYYKIRGWDSDGQINADTRKRLGL